MTSHPRTRRYFLTTLMLAAMLGLLVYLISGIFGGERGLASAKELRIDIAALQAQLKDKDAERAYLQLRVDALDESHPDLDMLSEQANRVLFFAEPNEIVIPPSLQK